MSKDLLKHKGYAGTVEYSLDDAVLHGKVLFVADLVTYEAESLPALKSAFEEAVDDYLVTCLDIGKEPDRPASGVFNVRTGEKRHQALILRSLREGMPLNSMVNQAIDLFLNSVSVEHNHHHEHAVTVTLQAPDVQLTAAGYGTPTFVSQWSAPNEQRKH